MKRSKIKGYINDLENKNKNFSFDKSIKILDISNAVYIDIIEKYDFKSITNYKNSKYVNSIFGFAKVEFLSDA